MTSRLPLDGIRVLEITNAFAGTSCTMHLADWGAEVIRVESITHWQPSARGVFARPSRDYLLARRDWNVALPNWEPTDRPYNLAPVFHSHCRNKLSMTVDLALPDGKEIFRQLLCCSDIFVENNAPDVTERLGISYPELTAAKPDVIMLQMPAYGSSGPHKHFRSYGSHLEGTVGLTRMRGYPDREPTTLEATYVSDAAGGLAGAFAVVLALRHRRRTGEGQRIESPLTENFVTWMGESLLDYQLNGRVRTPRANRSHLFAPFGAYPCRGEDRWMTICVETDAQWRALTELIGDAALQRPELDRVDRRQECHDEIDERIAAWTAGQDGRGLMERLQAAGVPAGVIQDAADVTHDPQLAARGFFQPVSHLEAGQHDYPGLQYHLRGAPNKLRSGAPLLGEHNRYVYQDLLGVGDERYAELEAEKHIGMDFEPYII